MLDHIVAVVTIYSGLTKIMKEPALQKTDQDVVGRFVIMKMSGESSHLLRSSSFIVYKTLQRKEQWREYASACHLQYYKNILYHMFERERTEEFALAKNTADVWLTNRSKSGCRSIGAPARFSQ